MPIIRVTPEEEEALAECRASDGIEVPKSDWPVYTSLASKGLVTLSEARGPGRLWKRAEPVVITSYPEVAAESEESFQQHLEKRQDIRFRMMDSDWEE